MGGFTGAGFTADDHDLVFRDRFGDLLAAAGNRQRFGEGDRWNRIRFDDTRRARGARFTARLVASAFTAFRLIRRLRATRTSLTQRIFFLRVRLRALLRTTRFARLLRRVSVGVLRRTAPGVAGVQLIGGRRRILVRRSGTFGYIRHGGAL
ncbi:hypothetical protein GGD41_000131 [Paraburkholderia bryophila]|uniref:Uncharacterized protein n=1 Tax=Paraburkholderia bryophila TaxID=420952 RepID=A0A7Z0AXP0_9BURK|nr:hypothetical protein [Paraburkholderia bryophila]NYH12903.1 hypothetical protein [Paraburkholderia bryophila]